MNRQRSFYGFLIAGVIALLLIGIAGFYWFFTRSPVNLIATTSQPNAAMFVSKSAPAMVSLLVNPDHLQTLEQEGELSRLKNSLLSKGSIDYRQDIQPWLGDEITLAVTSLDIDRDPDNGQQPGYLMVLTAKQPGKSREFIKLLFSQRVLAGAELAVEKYKGVKLIYDSQIDHSQQTKSSENEPNYLAGAVVGKFVLFANHPKVLREAINNVQAPDLNLSSHRQYQKATQQLTNNALATAFFNLPQVAQWQGVELLQPTYDSQLISLSLKPRGLLVETAFLNALEITSPSLPLSQTVGAVNYIPTSAGLVISGKGLNRLVDSDLAKLWNQAMSTIYGSEKNAVSRLLPPLANVQKRWGISFSEDIFQWIVGEYAIALLPLPGKTTPDWVFVAEKSPQMIEGIAHLDAIASTQGLNVSSLTLGQQKISAWTELTTTDKKTNDQAQSRFKIDTKIIAAHTTLDNYEIFTSNLEIMDKILKSQEISFGESPNFPDSFAVFPPLNQGYIYIDWTKSQYILEHQLPLLEVVELLGKPLFKNLRSLTLSSYSQETGTLKGGLFLQFH